MIGTRPLLHNKTQDKQALKFKDQSHKRDLNESSKIKVREDLEDSDAELSPSSAERVQDDKAGDHSDRKKKKRVGGPGSWNKPIDNPFLVNILYKSMFIHLNTFIDRDGKVQSCYGLKIADKVTPSPATSSVPGNTRVALKQKTIASTSKQPFGRLEIRKAGKQRFPLLKKAYASSVRLCSDIEKLLAREERVQALIQALDSSIHHLSTLDLFLRPIHQSKFVGLPAWL
ncbi:hypothetical protein Tco_0583084 [Tanacetum coccineum]